ncbi:type I restriction-modification enzyme R subunit C-terminal domain-containing protein, partial [Cribrihabitans sp. XS_ASV171]
ELTALVALIRRVCGLDSKLTRHSERVRKNFQDWVMDKQKGAGPKFTEDQMVWLRMIRDHLMSSFHIERDDLELSPFDGKGGMGQMYALFGTQMDEVMAEMNEAVA